MGVDGKEQLKFIWDCVQIIAQCVYVQNVCCKLPLMTANEPGWER